METPELKCHGSIERSVCIQNIVLQFPIRVSGFPYDKALGAGIRCNSSVMSPGSGFQCLEVKYNHRDNWFRLVLTKTLYLIRHFTQGVSVPKLDLGSQESSFV